MVPCVTLAVLELMEDAAYPSGAFPSNYISKNESHKHVRLSIHTVKLFPQIITHATKISGSLRYISSACPFCFTWQIEGGKKSLWDKSLDWSCQSSLREFRCPNPCPSQRL